MLNHPTQPTRQEVIEVLAELMEHNERAIRRGYLYIAAIVAGIIGMLVGAVAVVVR